MNDQHGTESAPKSLPGPGVDPGRLPDGSEPYLLHVSPRSTLLQAWVGSVLWVGEDGHVEEGVCWRGAFVFRQGRPSPPGRIFLDLRFPTVRAFVLRHVAEGLGLDASLGVTMEHYRATDRQQGIVQVVIRSGHPLRRVFSTPPADPERSVFTAPALADIDPDADGHLLPVLVVRALWEGVCGG